MEPSTLLSGCRRLADSRRGGDINTCVRAGADVTDLSRYPPKGEEGQEGTTRTACTSSLQSGRSWDGGWGDGSNTETFMM